MNETTLIKYYEVKKNFPSDSLKSYHYLDNNIKLQPSFSYENLSFIFDYIKWNWTNYEKTLLTKQDFELFHNSNLELSIDQLQPFISKKLLYMIQYKVDEFIETFYTYYFKGSLLKKIKNQEEEEVKPIKKDLFISIIIKNLLSAMKLSYYGFDVFNIDISEVITKELSKELLKNLRLIKYYNYPEILRDERDRIKNIQKHDCLNDYINELELLYNYSINSKNTSEYTSEIQNEEVNNNIKKPLKEIPKNLMNDLAEFMITEVNTNDKNKIINFLQLEKLNSISFTGPATHLSIIFTFLIVEGYYSKAQIENTFVSKQLKHIEDTKDKAQFHLTKHRSYFNNWVKKDEENGTHIFKETCKKPKPFSKIYSIFNKKY